MSDVPDVLDPEHDVVQRARWATEPMMSAKAATLRQLVAELADEVERLRGENAPAELLRGHTEGIAGSGTPPHLQPQSHSRVTLDVPPGTPVRVVTDYREQVGVRFPIPDRAALARLLDGVDVPPEMPELMQAEADVQGWRGSGTPPA